MIENRGQNQRGSQLQIMINFNDILILDEATAMLRSSKNIQRLSCRESNFALTATEPSYIFAWLTFPTPGYVRSGVIFDVK